MPPVSQKQRALMHAAASGKKWATRKVGPEVAKEFVDSDPGGKLPVRSSKSSAAKKRYGGK